MSNTRYVGLNKKIEVPYFKMKEPNYFCDNKENQIVMSNIHTFDKCFLSLVGLKHLPYKQKIICSNHIESTIGLLAQLDRASAF